MTVFIGKSKTGYSHEKCFLSSRKGCSTKISGEHYISEKLLNVIEEQNKTIDVAGLSWMPKGKIKSIGKSNLVSNILCTTHNSSLSDLDSSIGDFVSYISEIDKNLQLSCPVGNFYKVSGRVIEQWILKTIIGLVESENIKQKNGERFYYKPKCIDLLCEPNKRWPSGWGLYVSVPESQIHHSRSFELVPKSNQKTGEILAIGVKFNGFEMYLCLEKPNKNGSFGVYRPTELVFTKGEISSKIKIEWPMKTKEAYINFTQVGTYKGLAPTHDLERA
jgi:hypothetical protein